jgi:hypothetical protein
VKPSLVAWEDNLCVTWIQSLTPPGVTSRARRSYDAGGSWEPREAVFGGPGIATAYGIGVASHHESAYVVWADDRAGFFRIHANRARP